MRRVRQAIGTHFQLEVYPLGDPEVAEEARIKVEEARSAEDIAPGTTQHSGRRNRGEGRRIEIIA